MRLLNVRTLKLEYYEDWETVPPYAILSHVWEYQEVLFEDLQDVTDSQDIQDLQSRLNDLEHRIMGADAQLTSRWRWRWRWWSRDEQVEKKDSDETQPENPQLRRAKQKKGWSKIEGCCREAAKYGLFHVWIDTCCICKTSSSELSESINSMFAWYRDARLCIAYLGDVPGRDDVAATDSGFDLSKWFTRGWTLQELIAPREVLFYRRDWSFMGLRSSLANRITGITGIAEDILSDHILENVGRFSVAARLAWAAWRKTSREEDRAYALMGLFGVNMPTIYGEGQKAAFLRLQNEIFRSSADHSIFAWRDIAWMMDDDSGSVSGPTVTLHTIPGDSSSQTYTRPLYRSPIHTAWDLFAPSPDAFASPHLIHSVPYVNMDLNLNDSSRINTLSKYSMTSHGMRVQLLLELIQKHESGRLVFLAHLACKVQDGKNTVAIYLVSEQPGHFLRLSPKELVEIEEPNIVTSALTLEDVFVSSPRLDLAPSLRSVQVPIPKTAFLFYLMDKQLRESGFTMSDYAPSSWEWIPDRDSGGVKLRTTINPSYNDYGVLVFRSESKITGEQFAVVMTGQPQKFLAGIVENSGKSFSAAELLEEYKTGKSRLLLDLSSQLLIKTLEGGTHVVVGLSNLERRFFSEMRMWIVVNRK